MEALTGPEDYRQFDAARTIEFYMNPDRVAGPAVLYATSDWDALSQASSAGPREAMESVTARIEWPGAAPKGLPDIYLEFAYAGQAAIPLFGECSSLDEETQDLPVRLWRFRVTGQDGTTTELCFRACLPRVGGRNRAGHPGVLYGVFTVLDAQPFMEEA